MGSVKALKASRPFHSLSASLPCAAFLNVQVLKTAENGDRQWHSTKLMHATSCCGTDFEPTTHCNREVVLSTASRAHPGEGDHSGHGSATGDIADTPSRDLLLR
ncbi:unnamed protein product [Effrenium voratum]|uniref:Uncharacterized protein n=1 Tax=Effrenium voratum TaxID=2562239 RepID=A0AA36NES1_9DINO|nr:unnamed protein product [Effrenium voratum]